MKPRIVLAWYSDSFLKEIGGHLEKMGYEVITFNDGGETLHYLRENIVDAVMMGVVMPTLDGFEVTGAIIKEAIMPFQKIILVIAPMADAPTPRMRLIHGVPFAFWQPIREMKENLPEISNGIRLAYLWPLQSQFADCAQPSNIFFRLVRECQGQSKTGSASRLIPWRIPFAS